MFTRLDVARGMAGCTGSWPRLWNSAQDMLNGDAALTTAQRWGVGEMCRSEKTKTLIWKYISTQLFIAALLIVATIW